MKAKVWLLPEPLDGETVAGPVGVGEVVDAVVKWIVEDVAVPALFLATTRQKYVVPAVSPL